MIMYVRVRTSRAPTDHHAAVWIPYFSYAMVDYHFSITMFIFCKIETENVAYPKILKKNTLTFFRGFAAIFNSKYIQKNVAASRRFPLKTP